MQFEETRKNILSLTTGKVKKIFPKTTKKCANFVDYNTMETKRHSLAHLLAIAVLKKDPQAKIAIGPAIENGFYYDFDLSEKLEEKDLPKLEKEIKKLISQKLDFKREEITKKEAEEIFKDQPYKLELLSELEGPTIYRTGEFVDLCSGPHISDTSELNPEAFKLTSIAGAYWKGDENNKMLTRIYGIAFETKEELEKHLEMLEEAKKRDHRKIGKEMDLFSFHPEAPGMPCFHPKGYIIRKELQNFWEEAQKEFRYDYVHCPSMLDVSLWKRSGHWDHYKDDMFFVDAKEGEKQFALRPMDCPGAILIYNNSPKSYRDLPLRYAETGLITRKEQSGELGGLLRLQQFNQDDAHLFITEDQVENEIKDIIKLVEKIYKPFGIEYKAYLSTRPDDFMGDIESWNKAEKSLKKILDETTGGDYGVKEKDGAFYGPKIDYQLKDALGRTWQCATIQLDFQMPQKFDCVYTDKDGKEKTPIMIHRTIMGAFERFMGILIEHYAGKFPLWLSPVQVKILSISDKHKDYAQKIFKQLLAEDFRVEIDVDDESLGKKIRTAKMEKVPYILVLGDKELEDSKITAESRDEGNLGQFSIEDFIKKIKQEREEKK